MIFYILSAFKNPGYVLGNQILDSRNVTPYAQSVEQNKKESAPTEVNIMSSNFAQNIKRSQHQRKTSVLSRGLQVSRHERMKSSQGQWINSQTDQNEEQLDTSPYEQNQQVINNKFDNTATSQISINQLNTQTSQEQDTHNNQKGGHRRIPSQIKSIPFTQYQYPLNQKEQERKRAYQAIAFKIATSNSTVNTMNDDPDVQEYVFHPQKIKNELYQIEQSQINTKQQKYSQSHSPQPTDIENQKYLVNASTQEKTNMENEETLQQQQTQLSPRQIKNIQNQPADNNKRLLINRDKVRSDNPLVIDQVIEEQVSFEQQPDSDRIDNICNNKEQHQQKQKNGYNVTHKRLNEEIYTENSEQQTKSKDIETNQKTNDEQDSEDVVLFIEYKYCTICNVEQPLRCKHCKQCDHCVATYDHHCPWIGNCVGERNRCNFYTFLVFQTLQLVVSLFITFFTYTDTQNEIKSTLNAMLVFVILIQIGFFLMVSSLFGFHTYLISRNLTSCTQRSFLIIFIGEFLSWMKISYMKVWPKKYGSPFSRGSIKENFRLFCFYNFSKQSFIYQWTMPTKLPKLQGK